MNTPSLEHPLLTSKPTADNYDKECSNHHPTNHHKALRLSHSKLKW